MRSCVSAQVVVDVRDLGQSQPDPMENFFSALAIVCLRIFSALGVKVLACNKDMP